MKLEEFCFHATKTVEKYMDVFKIFKIADEPEFIGYSTYEDILKHF